MKKRILSMMLAIAMVVSLFAGITISVSAADGSYTLVTDAATLSAGDTIILVCPTKNTAAGPIGTGKYFTSVPATVSGDTVTSADAIAITLGGDASGWTLTTSEGTVSTSAAKAMNLAGNGVDTWTIEIVDGEATIKSTNTAYGWIQFNSGSPRFLNYASNQTAIAIYKLDAAEEGDCTHENKVIDSTDPAGCTEAGAAHYSCPDCGKTWSTLINALGHSFDAGDVVSPTCTEQGYTVYTCSVCGATENSDFVDPDGHNYINGICDVCGESEPVEVSLAGRYYVAALRSSGAWYYMTNDLGTASTKRYQAVDSGLTELPESITDEAADKVFVLEKNEDGTYRIYAEGIEADEKYLGHTSGNSGILVAADAALNVTVDVLEDGRYNIHYAASDEERYLALNTANAYFAWYKSGQLQNLALIPVAEQTHVHSPLYFNGYEATCYSEGKLPYWFCDDESCPNYGLYYSDEALTILIPEQDIMIPMGDHNKSETIAVISPSCTENGYTVYYCDVCGYRYADDEVAATGHDIGEDGICSVCELDPGKTVYIHMTDSYGDGWNGSAIKVYEDGVLIGTATIEDGFVGVWTGAYAPDKEYELYWVDSEYSDECSIKVLFGTDVEFTATRDECDYYSNECRIYPACEHSYDEGRVIAPNCTSQGYTVYQCSLCNHIYEDAYTDPLGHSFDETGCCTACGIIGYYTIFFRNDLQWSDIRVQYSGSSFAEDAEDPGVLMEYYFNEDNKDFYVAKIPMDAQQIRFTGMKDGELQNSPNSYYERFEGCAYYIDEETMWYGNLYLIANCDHKYNSNTDDGDCTSPLECSICHVVILEKEAHEFTLGIASDKIASEATCTEAAKYYAKCDNCEMIGDQTVAVGDPLGHTYEDGLCVNGCGTKETFDVTVTETTSVGGYLGITEGTATYGEDLIIYLPIQSDAALVGVNTVTVGDKSLIKNTEFVYGTDNNGLYVRVYGDHVKAAVDVTLTIFANVTFDLNGGDGTEQTKENLAKAGISIVDGIVTIPTPYGVPSTMGDPKDSFVREGHTYAGAKYGNGEDIELGAAVRNCTIILQWTINEYTVIFENEDGTELSKQTVEYGKLPEIPADPTKADEGCVTYTFAGWDKEIVAASDDATYTATYTANGSHTWQDDHFCSVCGNGDPAYLDENLNFHSKGINIQSFIGVLYMFNTEAALGYDNYYVSVTVGDGEAQILTAASFERTEYAIAQLKITAPEMTKSIKAVIFAEKDGELYHSEVDLWSVRDGVMEMMAEPTNDAHMTLMVDMLCYGAAAQTRWGIETDDLATALLTEEQLVYATTTVPELSATDSVIDTGADLITDFYCNAALQSTIELQFYINASKVENPENLEARITCEGKEGTTVVELTKFAGSFYHFTYDEMYCNDVRVPIHVTIYDKTTNEPVSATYVTSIEANAAKIATEQADMVNALMRFGDSAKAYFG